MSHSHAYLTIADTGLYLTLVDFCSCELVETLESLFSGLELETARGGTAASCRLSSPRLKLLLFEGTLLSKMLVSEDLRLEGSGTKMHDLGNLVLIFPFSHHQFKSNNVEKNFLKLITSKYFFVCFLWFFTIGFLCVNALASLDLTL